MKSESTELALFATPLVPAVIFAEGGVDSILTRIKAEVSAVAIDIATPQGRQECASLAYKVARSKTALDAMGKDLGEDHYRAWKSITSERARLVRELDELKDEVRRPLTDWENADKARIAQHQVAIIEIENAFALPDGADAAMIARRIDMLRQPDERDWQEFAKRAADVRAATLGRLLGAHQEATKREAAVAEAARIAAEKVAQERREHDALVAETARREAEAKAAAEAEAQALRVEAEKSAAAEKARRAQEAVKAEKKAADARAQKAEQDRLAAEAKARTDAIAAAEKAARDKATAVEAERDRAAAERAAEIAEIARREADKKHRAKVNGEALAALISFAALTDEQAKVVITAIVRHEIPHVSVAY